MKRPRILIAGAGAMGAVVGHVLHTSGAEITYLVRPRRRETLGTSLRLWDHGAGVVRELPRFDVVTTPEGSYDVVLVTLDGVALASYDGQQLLSALATALRDRDTILVIGTVGVRVREHVLHATGLPPERVVEGETWIPSYAVPAARFPSSTPAAEAGADFAFRLMGPLGFVVAPDIPAARSFAALFDASGLSRCQVTTSEELSLGNISLFPVFVMAEVRGWPEDPTSDTALWSLTVESVHEIQRLALHGDAGQQAATQTTAAQLARDWHGYATAMAPLDWTQFSRYHHGRKVWASDLQVLEACIAEGTREGNPMRATSEILRHALALGDLPRTV